jgi:hypothetical protein
MVRFLFLEEKAMNIDERNWSGVVTVENIDQIKEALRKRIATHFIAVDKLTLWTIDDLMVGDSVRFSPEHVELCLIYGHGKWREEKAVII